MIMGSTRLSRRDDGRHANGVLAKIAFRVLRRVSISTAQKRARERTVRVTPPFTNDAPLSVKTMMTVCSA